MNNKHNNYGGITMEYTSYNMNAYNLHLINTKKFKTITVDINFRRKINKDEITIRNLLKEVMVNSSYNYPTEKDLIKYTEELYDLKLLSSCYRLGYYSILSLKYQWVNCEKDTYGAAREQKSRRAVPASIDLKLAGKEPAA